jgi:hypothetical protein
MDLSELSDVTVSSWIYDINTYKLKRLTYWIHKIQISNNWYMTNFNYNLTNIDLKTTDIEIAEKRSIVIMNSKTNIISNAITKLNIFSRKLSNKSIELTPELSKTVIDFTSKLSNFNI